MYKDRSLTQLLQDSQASAKCYKSIQDLFEFHPVLFPKSPKSIADAIGVSVNTLYQRLDKPQNFRLEELLNLQQLLDIPLSELLGEQPQKGGQPDA